jgi:3-oxoacyl-[acyl-carrier-protein] synthase II
MGAVTPVGRDVPSTWHALLGGRSGVRQVPLLVKAQSPCTIAADVSAFRPEEIPTRQDIRRFGRSTQFALAAALEAFDRAGLRGESLHPERCGVIVGTGIGDGSEHFHQVKNYLANGSRGVHPLYLTRAMPNAPTAAISLEFGFQGPSFAVASACSSAGHGIALAVRLIQHGDADLFVVGGTEEVSHELMVVAFHALKTLSRRNDHPEKACRPFDLERDGMVLGEGAAILILEERGRALRRGAPILAEVAGAGMAGDAYHLVAPDPTGKGAVLAMRAALTDAGRRPEQVAYVNAHGTSTPLNDQVETLALREVFGLHAKRLAVSATKSMIGHLIGGAAGVGLIATVLSVKEGVVHPTINYERPDPECDLDYVPNEARRMEVPLALVNAFGFGGHCVSLALAKSEA